MQIRIFHIITPVFMSHDPSADLLLNYLVLIIIINVVKKSCADSYFTTCKSYYL